MLSAFIEARGGQGYDKIRDANPPYLVGMFPIFVNIFDHFGTQIWQPPYFWQVLCHVSYM